MDKEQELYKKIEDLNQEIIHLKDKPSEEHTILMMTHSSLCGELKGRHDKQEQIVGDLESFYNSILWDSITIKRIKQILEEKIKELK